MKKNIGILHLSDLHASIKSKSTIKSLVNLLKDDLKRINLQYDTKIDFVCISGDLINSGDKADEELNIVFNDIIEPLMNELTLDKNKFFVVPGNHEIKKDAIIDYIENGLTSMLTTETAIEEFLSREDEGSLQRINYFNEFSSQFSGVPILNKSMLKSYSLKIENITIGIVCINSAWRSTGVGHSEKGKMVIGRKLIMDGFESINTADIKICMMHHPLDWLVEEDEIAIQKCINQYDIVLNGHIHETSTKIYTSYNGQTLFNTCGKFDNSSDIYNGYSVISINPYTKESNVILRQYFDNPRNCFDKAIGLCPDGIFAANLGKKDDSLALAYKISHSIYPKFLEYANSFFVSNLSSGKTLKSFEESFIVPTFSKYSEYEKETNFEEGKENFFDEEKEEPITLSHLCNSNTNFLLIGKKETGKTTILHYIIKYCISNFNMLNSVPILIDCEQIDLSGKNVIHRAALQYINSFCSDEDAFSQNDINKLLEAGLCTILFDNFDAINSGKLSKINAFLTEFKNNKFIFSETEETGTISLRKIAVEPICEYVELYISPLSKGQIRSVAKQYMQENEFKEYLSLLDKVMLCFKKTTLPKTPFILSIILSLCNNSDFTPINEAVVMEQFMESLLEKSSFCEADSSKFDFRAKEDFLIYIVSYMNKENRFYLSDNEFDELVIKYHAYTGFSTNETHFDTLFFEKGVLIKYNNTTSFRYACMIEYYIAKKAGQEPDFLDYIMSEKNYLNYSNEMTYYTGLYRRDNNILNIIYSDLLSYYNIFQYKLDEMMDYQIGLDIAVPSDMLKKQLTETRLSQEKSDELTDSINTTEQVFPEKINKKNDYDDMSSFSQALLIYGNCIKNLELISKKEKDDAYHMYLTGLCILLSIMKDTTEKDCEIILKEMKNKPENYSEQEITETKNIFNDIIRITLPLWIQNVALENIGTIKLCSILEETIKNSTKDSFEKFFSVFIYADLRLPGLQKVLLKYVNEVENKSLLKIIFFKLLYYYDFRYFSTSLDSFFENILADINIKLQNTTKQFKSIVVNEIKSKRTMHSNTVEQ